MPSMNAKSTTTILISLIALLIIFILMIGYININQPEFLTDSQFDGTLTDEAIWLQVTIYYATVGTMPPTALPSRTFSAGDHATAWHFQQTAYWSATRSRLANDAWLTQIYFETMTALAPTATSTPTATPTWTPPPPTATPPLPTAYPHPTGIPGGQPLCPGGGGEWMWVDGELVFVCGVSWE